MDDYNCPKCGFFFSGVTSCPDCAPEKVESGDSIIQVEGKPGFRIGHIAMKNGREKELLIKRHPCFVVIGEALSERLEFDLHDALDAAIDEGKEDVLKGCPSGVTIYEVVIRPVKTIDPEVRVGDFEVQTSARRDI